MLLVFEFLAILLLGGQLYAVSCDLSYEELAKHPGHLKGFASEGVFKYVDEVDRFPNTADFFRENVVPTVPLLMRGIVNESKPYLHWTDNYFLNMSISEDQKVHIQKKTNPVYMDKVDFQDFVRTYRESDVYLKDNVMPFLRKDIPIPPPLQCKGVLHNSHSTLLWFSNGGTKSVLHTDGADNILCVFDGKKEVTLLHPDQYLNKIGLRPVMAAVSSVNVESVDYTKHPALGDIEYYYKALLNAGDCIYIPYNWIHQVNSVNRNIAVNFWWYRQDRVTDSISHCKSRPEPEFTMDDIRYITGAETKRRDEFVNFLNDLTSAGPVTLDDFYPYFIKVLAVRQYYVNIFPSLDDVHPVTFVLHSDRFFQIVLKHPDVTSKYDKGVKPVIRTIDQNNDGMLSNDEVLALSEQAMDGIYGRVRAFRDFVAKLTKKVTKFSENDQPQLERDVSQTQPGHLHSEL